MITELEINTPWMNAAGTLGFSPSARWAWPQAPGAFVTNPISLLPRTPAKNRALLRYPGGFLLHGGLPNPGLARVLRQHAAAWKRSSLPVWVHLLAERPEEIHSMVLALEEVEGVAAVEVGLPPEADAGLALELISAAQGELPVAACVPLNLAGQAWLAKLAGMGVRALTLGAPRGTLPNAAGALVQGRLYGPGLYPLMLSALTRFRSLGLPLIAGVGAFTVQQGEALLQAGASAVQLDAALWR